jgi:hypothetical protein
MSLPYKLKVGARFQVIKNALPMWCEVLNNFVYQVPVTEVI